MNLLQVGISQALSCVVERAQRGVPTPTHASCDEARCWIWSDVLAANSLMTGDVRHAHHAATVPASEGGGRRTAALHIPSLDGLRAVSFLIVFLAHSGISGWCIPGGFGVTVFFYLSGFLITTLMRMERQATGTVNLPTLLSAPCAAHSAAVLSDSVLCRGLTLLGLLPGQLSPTVVLAQSLHVSNYWFIWRAADGVRRPAPSRTGRWQWKSTSTCCFRCCTSAWPGVMPRQAQARSVLALCAAHLRVALHPRRSCSA